MSDLTNVDRKVLGHIASEYGIVGDALDHIEALEAEVERLREALRAIADRQEQAEHTPEAHWYTVAYQMRCDAAWVLERAALAGGGDK
jgi:hypothetical protein